jgi:hypothetical protein
MHHQAQLPDGFLSITAWYIQIFLPLLIILGLCNKIPQTGWFKQQKFIVSGRSLRSRCDRAVLLRAMRESVLYLYPSFWWFTDSIWHSLTCRGITQSLFSSSHGILPVWCFSPNFPFL